MNKNTHLTIIATFAIVFIVIYLYYTITDLRKLQVEVAKLSKQVQSLQQPLPQCTPTQIHPQVVPPRPTMTFAPVVESAPVVNDDDASSVATEEIKNILDRQDSEEEVVDALENVEIVSEVRVQESVDATDGTKTEEAHSVDVSEESPAAQQTSKAPRGRKPKSKIFS